ncbi:MAG: hypothetical protein F6K03_04175 [Kamptonema sp. SIO4C4]|nr:hypothetical protein [Kamptonema sp. SIO4C4]
MAAEENISLNRLINDKLAD